MGAGLGQADGDAAPDAEPGAGDDGDAVVDAEAVKDHPRSLPRQTTVMAILCRVAGWPGSR
jgi:hypothetical protein